MSRILLAAILFIGNSVFAGGKVAVITFQDGKTFPPTWGCLLRYNESSMTIGQTLQFLETNPALAKSLKNILEIDSGKLDEILIQKAVAYQKKNKLPVGDCSDAKINDVFDKVAGLKSCTILEKLSADMNKTPIASENFNFSDRCQSGSAAATGVLKNPSSAK
jgi:hypothetical protein